MCICLPPPPHKNIHSMKMRSFACFIHLCIQYTWALRYLLNEWKNKGCSLTDIHSWRCFPVTQEDPSIAPSSFPSFLLYQGPSCYPAHVQTAHLWNHTLACFGATWPTAFASLSIILGEPESLHPEQDPNRPSANVTVAHPTLPRQSQQPHNTLNNVCQY